MSRPDIEALLNDFRQALAAASSPAELSEVKRLHTGKKSPVKAALKSLRAVPAEERPAVAQAINQARQTMESELSAAESSIAAKALEAKLDAEWMDLSMPGQATRRGAIHPVTVVEQQALSVMRRLGFTVEPGPEVDHPYYNFDALNIPKHHPARDMQDTFWVDGGWLLRSHTTSVQARLLEHRKELPIRVATMGRVYRNEAVDATHLAMFHQLDCIWVDHGLNFSHMKGLLTYIARALYGDRPVRFKPKFYPYTEPSVGADIQCGTCHGTGQVDGQSCEACHGAGWVTVLGAGMIHPKVFMEFGFDPAEVSGIAFGLGTTRMASQWAGVNKVRKLYDGDIRVLEALQRGSAS